MGWGERKVAGVYEVGRELIDKTRIGDNPNPLMLAVRFKHLALTSLTRRYENCGLAVTQLLLNCDEHDKCMLKNNQDNTSAVSC